MDCKASPSMYASYLNLPLDYVVLGGLVSGEPKLPRAAQLSHCKPLQSPTWCINCYWYFRIHIYIYVLIMEALAWTMSNHQVSDSIRYILGYLPRFVASQQWFSASVSLWLRGATLLWEDVTPTPRKDLGFRPWWLCQGIAMCGAHARCMAYWWYIIWYNTI